ncbi:uncharacterized protein LOC128997213 isoform X2 [Macrosteles quadrilineatus]|uniref:uncharacterized protein LOC128997213 isoform X2 n=1 Tax=Macrosteles quadrilineatus TaxID=74068 RepID=UPI0023E285F5|nr:uncharacterized protein LOC128997213 isoform X2 [Macrosteles quadrilineatus]
MNFSRLLILVLLGKILSSECKNVNSYSKRRIPYQVSVEVDSDFKCTGAIINVYWVAAVSSCLQNASANKVIVRAATRAPLWRGSAHRVQQLVTSPPCSSGHLILLKVFNKFKFNGKTRPVTMLPRTPSSGDIGWESTWPCIQVPYNTISQRPITILEPSFCKEITTDPENVIPELWWWSKTDWQGLS